MVALLVTLAMLSAGGTLEENSRCMCLAVCILLSFVLYTEREATEEIYEKGVSRDGIADPKVASDGRFALLRWAALAECFIERLDEYEGRSWLKRAWRWLRRYLPAQNDESIEQAMELIYRTVAERLRSYGYEVEDDGSLVSAVNRMERQKAAYDEFLARSQRSDEERDPPAKE